MFRFVTSCLKSSISIGIRPTINHFSTLVNTKKSTFLVPKISFSLTQWCGFKVMGKVRRRCKDCYLVKREERWYVLCKTHPRHKQMQIAKDPKNTWILSHATQSKIRPW